MSQLSEMLVYLRRNARLSQQELADKTGITRSAIGMYETGKREPDLATLEVFANIFEVDMNTITGSKPVSSIHYLTEKDKQDIGKDLKRIVSQLGSSGDLMFDGDPMSDEARESMLAAIELGLRAAKLKNKERFTPKKYRKD